MPAHAGFLLGFALCRLLGGWTIDWLCRQDMIGFYRSVIISCHHLPASVIYLNSYSLCTDTPSSTSHTTHHPRNLHDTGRVKQTTETVYEANLYHVPLIKSNPYPSLSRSFNRNALHELYLVLQTCPYRLKCRKMTDV